MTTYTPLTREQKLLAEIVVQLGNIVEAITSASEGEDTSNLNAQIAHLQNQLTAISAERAALTNQLTQRETEIAELQQQIANFMTTDLTPDSVVEVMSHLGINYDANNDDTTGNSGA